MAYSLAESWESVTAARLWEVSRWAGQTRERVYGCGWLCQPCFGLWWSSISWCKQFLCHMAKLSAYDPKAVVAVCTVAWVTSQRWSWQPIMSTCQKSGKPGKRLVSRVVGLDVQSAGLACWFEKMLWAARLIYLKLFEWFYQQKPDSLRFKDLSNPHSAEVSSLWPDMKRPGRPWLALQRKKRLWEDEWQPGNRTFQDLYPTLPFIPEHRCNVIYNRDYIFGMEFGVFPHDHHDHWSLASLFFFFHFFYHWPAFSC